MRFCQSDGTPLIEAGEPVDPYKTMVASQDDISAALGSTKTETPPDVAASKEEEEVLQIPSEPDPNKTVYASEAEIRSAMSGDEQVMEIPPLAESTPPEPPKFSEPSLSPPAFNDPTPPSPFSQPDPIPAASARRDDSSLHSTSPPIPSPFSEPKSSPSTPFAPEPNAPVFKEPEPAFEPIVSSPVNQQMAQAEWVPPPSPDANWQNQQIGQNTPFQPPPAGTSSGLNQTLPIVSLILGIISLCCYISPVTGIAALVTGFMGMKNVNRDPDHYGGKTLAIIGMILGGLFFLVGVAYYVIIILMYVGIIAGSMIPNL